MKINYFCPRWGSEHLICEKFANKAKNAGYDGIELSLSMNEGERNKSLDAISKAGLLHIAQHWETKNPNFNQHMEEYHERLEMLVASNPIFINSQTGRDFFTFEQNKSLIDLADAVSQQSGVPIYHETHRGKFSFAAHIMKSYLQSVSNLEITLDISHWCSVAETFLEDQTEAVDLAISRTRHIHARVGFPEGPQVPDPRTPENQDALQKHLNWWQEVVNLCKKDGVKMLTVTPEFGPYPYMTAMPFTALPISDQWEINVFMKDYLKKQLIV